MRASRVMSIISLVLTGVAFLTLVIALASGSESDTAFQTLGSIMFLALLFTVAHAIVVLAQTNKARQ